MCAACVAQGIGYVGSALVGLQVMGTRAKAKRRSGSESGEGGAVTDSEPETDGQKAVGARGIGGATD